MLKLENINTFYGQAHILRDLSLSVPKGEVVALLGRNGAGKSTTLKSIMQLVRTRRGTITYNAEEINRLAPYKIAKRGIGYVPEDRRIFSDLTVVENLEVGRASRSHDKQQWTQDAIFELFPNLKERRNNRGKALSGGEQQMLTLARTLMGNPQLLLLDEPTEGIAPVIVEQMAMTILHLKQQGLTVLLSEQNMHFAKHVADRAVIIEGGSVQFEGSFERLEAKPELKSRYLAV